MKRITKNLLAHWQYVGGIFLLFIVELYCITGISDCIYNMKNTGAKSSGIEYMVADALTSDAWQRVELYMSDSERAQWNRCYEKREDGLYYLSDSFKSQSSMEGLEKSFLMSQAIVWQLSHMDQEVLSDLLEENGELEKTDYMEIRDLMEVQLEKAGEQEISRYAMSFVREQSEKAGVNLMERKTRYLSGTVFLIVLYLLVLTASAVGMAYLTGFTQRLMGKWIQEPQLRSAGQLMLYVVTMIFSTVAIYIAALHQLGQYKAGDGWYWGNRIFLPVLMILVWLMRIRPELEILREKLSFSGVGGYRYIKRVQLLVVAGIPAVLLLAGCSAVWSVCFSRMMFLFIADLTLASGTFLIPDIAQAADCVEETFSDPDSNEW